MDEQVVPTFGAAEPLAHYVDHTVLGAKKTALSTVPAPSKAAATIKHYKRKKQQQKQKAQATTTVLSAADSQTVPVTSPPSARTPEKKHDEPDYALVASEYIGKPRWQTPRRTGKWKEPWHSAIQLCPHRLYSPESLHASISLMLRGSLSNAIVTYVGPLLSATTVKKWLCLLCEYLELNTDEEILVICLLRRYARAGGLFVTPNDWTRPQKWECVVAIACYLAVLLTEEFPGKTILDLKELLGADFRFAQEQILFLKTIDWRICVTEEEIREVIDGCKRCIDGDADAYTEMDRWFCAHSRDVADAKLWTAKTKEQRVVVEKEVETEDAVVLPDKGQKKRTYSAFASGNNVPMQPHQEEGVVPQYVIRRIDPSLNLNAAFFYAHHQQAAFHPHAHPMAHPHHIIPTAYVAPQHMAMPHHDSSQLVAAHAHLAAAAAAGMHVPMWGAPPPPKM